MTSKIVSVNPLIKPVENCFEEMKVQLSLQLPPMDTQSLCSGTKSMLDRLVFKYKTELGGIIISYYDVIHTDKEAKIFYDSPYLGMNIHVKFLVFKPFKDQILNGVVKRVSTTHISLLVFGTISASIPKSNIPKSFAFDHSSNMFMNKQTKATISVGTKIAFKVIDVSADRHNIGIQGDMTDLTSTGIIGFDENQSLQFGSQYETPNKNVKNNKYNNNNNNNNNGNNNTTLINTENNNNITKFDDDSEKESEEEPKPIIIKEEPKIVSVKVESKKVVVKEEEQKSSKKDKDIKKEKESKKRKKDSSDESDESEEDKKKKSTKKEKESSSKKSSKKVKVESSSESSEDEKEKKKKKKK
ncbi:RNA polymerase I subunit [Dictyostelium discoideum AX4]|uniref:Probable DNA-directed RNA polymerase I subunit RPA43 n=1 Tax=Dictyostelium discoideum TaxID=44689 RepID=RPA43_DICDI|nr:RNA polymerase I subunit [Dictyostelium discoideum AX4]Q55FA4.1 RecName: Full=Probable DNA-directed RNA polymerase I subunit RPA43 [Dictyostelium discoideum]EAL73552.1 RNA polymerase I subunit [Dictyostelium discoideum AX4]|eukprot:XP_647629.1 RNA polymerase I subunit [Dictyostelium discoideum AX4]